MEDFRLVDELSQKILWDGETLTWKPEATWRTLLASPCNGDENLIAAVCNYTRRLRDEPEEDLPIMAKAPSLAPGIVCGTTTIAQYRIIRELGKGGMGIVYEVEHGADLKWRKALKLVNLDQNTEAFIGRFRSEKRLLSALNHPNIIKITDDGTAPDGRPYFVMELVEGAQRLDVYCSTNKLSLLKRLELFRTVCDAVHFAHTNNVLHRDLKASNILVSKDGEIQIVDFGLATYISVSATEPIHAEKTVSIGTPGSMSPEQQQRKPLTTKTDIYHLGLVLNELVATVPGYLQGTSLEGVPSKQSLDSVIMDALRTRPEDRHSSVESMSQALLALTHSLPPVPRPRSLRTVATTVIRARPLLAAAGLAFLLYSSVMLWKNYAETVKNQQEEARLQAKREAESESSIEQAKKDLAKVFGAAILPTRPVVDGILRGPDLTLDFNRLEASIDRARSEARKGSKRLRMGLGLLSIFGYDKFILKPDYDRHGRIVRQERPSTPVSRLREYALEASSKSKRADPLLSRFFTKAAAEEGFQWIKTLADQGCDPAPALLAQVLSRVSIGNIPTDKTQSLNWAKKAAAKQDPLGHLILGNFYSTGLPELLPVNYSLAITHWTQAAENGMVSAQDKLASHYESRDEFSESKVGHHHSRHESGQLGDLFVRFVWRPFIH